VAEVPIFGKACEKAPMLGCWFRLFVSDSLNGATAHRWRPRTSIRDGTRTPAVDRRAPNGDPLLEAQRLR
jgi:hypothetical protein